MKKFLLILGVSAILSGCASTGTSIGITYNHGWPYNSFGIDYHFYGQPTF